MREAEIVPQLVAECADVSGLQPGAFATDISLDRQSRAPKMNTVQIVSRPIVPGRRRGAPRVIKQGGIR